MNSKKLIKRLTRFRLFVHQGDRHDDIVRNGKTDLEVGAKRELHAQKHVREDCDELGIRSSLHIFRRHKKGMLSLKKRRVVAYRHEI